MSSVIDLNDHVTVEEFGGKAANLSSMMRAELPVPAGFGVGITAFDSDGTLNEEAKSKITTLLSGSKLYAVRSSALAEDSSGASWAGQFESFLDTSSDSVIQKIEECHNSSKSRALAYAAEQGDGSDFSIAVVVQEMIKPDFAGVLFTRHPITGADELVTEFVEGLGEALVSGQADPTQVVWSPGDFLDVPFDIDQLTRLAKQVEAVFGSPQDIEWVWADNRIWLVQSRPITTAQTRVRGYYLGEPDELFYWGPSRAVPMYMSDFMSAVEKFFIQLADDPDMPDPPKTLVLFHNKKMVWLNNAVAFSDFTESMFETYLKLDNFENDYKSWQDIVSSLDAKSIGSLDLVEGWTPTLFPEFSLYGAETVIAKMLSRFDPKTRQLIWGTYTYPAKPTFLSKIDNELYETKNIEAMSGKYPWIEDGYSGVYDSSTDYFTKRLKIVQDNPPIDQPPKERQKMGNELGLTENETKALDLARELAEFIDERKLWMMRTRGNIRSSAGNITNGWLFNGGKSTLMSEDQVSDFWQRYVDFKVSTTALSGVVASNGGRHFVNGEVRVLDTPTDSVEDDMILVVPATSPSYVPLMRKARALITDHGGMMSHAAIVGREFNLPCIVGTKNGTKILKNGDRVVLDLVKGEISK